MKFRIWKKSIYSKNCSDFPILNYFSNEEGRVSNDWTDTTDIDSYRFTAKKFVSSFPKEQSCSLKSNPWILQPFIDELTVDEEQLNLQANLYQKVSFKDTSYLDIWLKLWHVPKYKKLFENTISLLIQIPSTYLCESEFSSLSPIKSKKRNSIKKINHLMIGAGPALEVAGPN